MKKAITKEEQKRINELLDARRQRELEKLFPTKQYSKDEDICRMLQYEHDNMYGSQSGKAGMTYLEIEQFNNTYNNFR